MHNNISSTLYGVLMFIIVYYIVVKIKQKGSILYTIHILYIVVYIVYFSIWWADP